MQIEQVIGGVGGDTGAQAIQLRMRGPFQNQMQFSRIRAWDANGLNPVLLVDFTVPVPNNAMGSRVLAATASFAALTSPNVTPDAIMNPIPVSYLAAGSITFESDGGAIYWRLSWGGAAYTGPGTGLMTNDADGIFNPPYPIALPTAGAQAVRFKFADTAPSITNLNDYQLTAGAATFQGNTGAAGVVTPPAVSCPIQPGIDLFTTPGGGATYQDFSGTPIPVGFFGPGSDPFGGLIILGGRPLDPSPASPIGPTDTIVRRNAQANPPANGGSDIVPIEIVALNLVSVNPITVTYNGGQTPEQWTVQVCLSSTDPQPIGGLRITTNGCGCAEGGTFDANLPVLPRFVFTRTSDLSTRVLDFGSAGIPPVDFQDLNGHWMPSDPGFNIVQAPPGLSFDHDCSPITPAVGPQPGSSNFIAGLRMARCEENGCVGPPVPIKRMTIEQALLAQHGVLPTQDCLSPDSDGDGLCDDADNCVNTPNPRQEDLDDDGVGDACDNCPPIYNFCQEDLNGNQIGDVCEVSGVEDGASSRVMLGRPVPNPTSGLLSYALTLPRAGKVRVGVYDLSGRLIRRLIDRELDSGRHLFQWDARGESVLRSGVYVLRLESDGVEESRKFTFVR